MSNEHYPFETLSFNNLPIKSPLIYLEYGGILTKISDIVKFIRRENRRLRLKFLNKRLKIGNMLAVYKEILEDAKLLKNYNPDNWICKKNIDKSNFYNYIVDRDIPLKYLEDAYNYQSKGAPVFYKGNIIKIKKGCHPDYNNFYGILLEDSKTKTTIGYNRINKDFTLYYNDNIIPGKIYRTFIWECELIDSGTENNIYLWNKQYNQYCREL